MEGPPTKLVPIKEEEIEEEVDLQELFYFHKNDSVWEEDDWVPKPLEKLRDMGPPPFLTKTYDMVSNPEIDEIISWGNTGVSFVVWDPHKFTTHLLPKYFKHSNFSSFVRQLNTYGFRKVHFDQWEFANAAFRKDKKHLLKSIKRRNQCVTHDNSRSEMEKLKVEHEELKATIHDLKQQLLNSEQSLATMEDRLKCVEWKQKEFLLFIAKAMKNTGLLLQKYKCLENGHVYKRPKLADDDPLLISVKPNMKDDAFGTASSLTTSGTRSSSPEPDYLSSSGNYIMWEKLMEDDVICEDDEDELMDANHTKFLHELQDLISLGSLVNNIGQLPCPRGQ